MNGHHRKTTGRKKEQTENQTDGNQIDCEMNEWKKTKTVIQTEKRLDEEINGRRSERTDK